MHYLLSDRRLVGNMYQLKVRVDKRFTITLPKEVRERLDIREGDVLRLIVDRDAIILKKAMSLVEFVEGIKPRGSIRDFLKMREEEVGC